MSLVVDIRKKYKDFRLDVQLDSENGALGILGASGSGKSMTLRCIAGLETPSEGIIQLNQRVLFDSDKKINLPPQQRRVGYLFQSYALFPHMTVAGNIACALQGSKQQKQQQIQQLVSQFQLSGLDNRYPAQLSGGQQQRVALARIWASKPELLLLDEPFAALDSHLKEVLLAEMSSLLQQYGKDTILVTHNRDEVYNLCHRLLVLDQGISLACGDTQQMFRNPGWVEAALVTGCKNISKARQSGPNRVFAEDWETELQVQPPIPKNLTHVGIRAHDFAPRANHAINAIPVGSARVIQSPFEWNIIFRNPAAASPTKEIWWKIPKTETSPNIPEYLGAPPHKILLLTSNQSPR